MKKYPFPALILLILVVFCARITVYADDTAPVNPAKNDKCIVCGMFVSKYPDWIGEIIFNDGRVLFFDGCKDLFKYYLNVKKYSRDKDRSDISAIYVTDYYDVSFINAVNAFYVVGSDVYGPMGRELVAVRSESDAEAFLKDHQGKQIIRFNEISNDLIHRLD